MVHEVLVIQVTVEDEWSLQGLFNLLKATDFCVDLACIFYELLVELLEEVVIGIISSHLNLQVSDLLMTLLNVVDDLPDFLLNGLDGAGLRQETSKIND